MRMLLCLLSMCLLSLPIQISVWHDNKQQQNICLCYVCVASVFLPLFLVRFNLFSSSTEMNSTNFNNVFRFEPKNNSNKVRSIRTKQTVRHIIILYGSGVPFTRIHCNESVSVKMIVKAHGRVFRGGEKKNET